MSEPPLRLAFLADPRSVHSRRWVEYFVDRGHSVAWLLSDDVPDDGVDPRIEVHRYRRFGPRRIPFFSSLQGRGALRALLLEVRPEILHAQYVSQYGWQARRAGFRPYVATGWGSDLLLDPSRSLRAGFWTRQVLGHAALVTVPSEQLMDVARTLGARTDRLHRIPFGVDTRAFSPSAARDAVERAGLGARPIVFSPRAIRPLYRQETVLRAIASLRQEVTLVMTARHADAVYLARLRAQAAELGMQDRVRVIDEIGKELMTNLFQAAEVVVSVPASDGLPISVLEAMACGAPVISTDLPGPREALGPHAESLVVPVGDPAALRDAIDRLLGLATSDRRALAEALRQRAVEEFDFRTWMERMEGLYFAVRAAA